MKERIHILAALLLYAMVSVASFILGCHVGKGDAEVVTVTDTIVRTDTVTLVGERDTLIRIVRTPYPVAVASIDTVFDTDTVFVYLERESRLYEVPDTLKVWYSGVDPSIDSTKVFVRERIVTETRTVKAREYPNTMLLEAGATDISATYLRSFGRVSLGVSAGSTWDGRPVARAVVGGRF